MTGRHPTSTEAKLIRAGVHSESNHNAMIVRHFGTWYVAEAKPPRSCLTPIQDYQALMDSQGYEVGFYRLLTLTEDQREAAADFFIKELLNLPYPKKQRMALLALPIYNALIDKTGLLPPMRLTWCSQLVKRAYLSQDPDCLDGRNGKKKKLFTPKTLENRILQHKFDDMTRYILK